ncbi:MAG: thioredoxin-disulfide reductase [Bacteroidales bacterium]|jgi:thioredoxin reductase (NADPH)|nr:thioredoxin-disulfide reductase [Bacteroidales bacterium]MDD2570684.1 thioredoxin-disulfide reductase [Bacteroidales bacterium]MDD2813307.1 thioredoxin-disulfide reductase [Bacteroidales bacterium]MDD3384923.1 thioredoxin-disulfide reductase [Bacteroidales bacterium]MDD3812174.1 thioredoxin-disulfide reductase [Bacteroidales bacterium]
MIPFSSFSTNESSSQKVLPLQVKEQVRVLILGSGPAGYTAAIYAARANLKPILYQGLQAGGQLTTTTEVDNFPGYPEGVTGPVLMDDLQKQAERFGTEVRWGMATAVDFTGPKHKVWIDDEYLIEADAVIIATGATAKYLGLESEEKFKGSGVSACATCDGFFYRGQDVAVVGGGDTAAEEATYLAGLCRKVYVIVRKPYLRASKAMQEKVARTPNVEVLFEHVTKEIIGNQTVEGVILVNSKGEEVKVDITGFFVAIGHEPNSSIFKPFLEMDEIGYINTIPGTSKTNVPGVFACGDVQDKHYRQAITAAGSGCMAALDAERYLS